MPSDATYGDRLSAEWQRRTAFKLAASKIYSAVATYFHLRETHLPDFAGRTRTNLAPLLFAIDGATRQGSPASRPRVLIASSSWWAFPVQLAIGLAKRGISVHAVCPRGHPLRKAASVNALYIYHALRPIASLERAIRQANPSIIIPCDDRTVAYLHGLHAKWKSEDLDGASLIERSLGQAGGFEAVRHRSTIISLARNAGIAAPAMVPLANSRDVVQAAEQFGLPVVLKVDESWGGLGVVIADNAENAVEAFDRLARRPTVLMALKRLFVDRDGFSILPWLKRIAPRVNAQGFAKGRPTNCAVACWQGELLACSSVEVIHARTMLGASTVVRHIDNPQMMDAAKTIVRHLRLSGLCGFDFLLDDATGNVSLVECNPRATPLCHLDFGLGADPLNALVARVFGLAHAQNNSIASGQTVAFFPQCWLQEPGTPLIKSSYHDVPWSEPEVVRELMKVPWPERGFLARLARRYRNTAVQAPWCIE